MDLVYTARRLASMSDACRKYLAEAVLLAEHLMETARGGAVHCDDDDCLLVYGIMLDSAAKIERSCRQRLAELNLDAAAVGKNAAKAD